MLALSARRHLFYIQPSPASVRWSGHWKKRCRHRFLCEILMESAWHKTENRLMPMPAGCWKTWKRWQSCPRWEIPSGWILHLTPVLGSQTALYGFIRFMKKKTCTVRYTPEKCGKCWSVSMNTKTNSVSSTWQPVSRRICSICWYENSWNSFRWKNWTPICIPAADTCKKKEYSSLGKQSKICIISRTSWKTPAITKAGNWIQKIIWPLEKSMSPS